MLYHTLALQQYNVNLPLVWYGCLAKSGFGLLAGPWWDSETENKPPKPQEVTDV